MENKGGGATFCRGMCGLLAISLSWELSKPHLYIFLLVFSGFLIYSGACQRELAQRCPTPGLVGALPLGETPLGFTEVLGFPSL